MFEPEIRDSAFTPRWVIGRWIRRQMLVEHLYFVSYYADQIAEFIEWKGDRLALLRRAMRHDMHENVTGDVPGTAKRAMDFPHAETHPACTSLMRIRHGADWDRWNATDPEMEAIIKVADRFEELMYLNDEMLFGNTTATEVYRNSMVKLEEAVAALPCGQNAKDSLEGELMKTVEDSNLYVVSKVFTG